jgi:hypothetical protein
MAGVSSSIGLVFVSFVLYDIFFFIILGQQCRLLAVLYDKTLEGTSVYSTQRTLHEPADCAFACEEDEQCFAATFTTYIVTKECKLYRYPEGGISLKENPFGGRAKTWIKGPSLCSPGVEDSALYHPIGP